MKGIFISYKYVTLKITEHIRAFYEYLCNDRKVLNGSHAVKQIKKQDHRNRLIAIFVIHISLSF